MFFLYFYSPYSVQKINAIMKIKTTYFALGLLLLVPVLTLGPGCKKDKDPTKPLVFVTPDALHVFSDVGDVVSFDILVSSEAGLSAFRIETKIDDGQSFTQTVFEESLSGVGTYNKLYEMIAPLAATGSSLIITFIATDANGLQSLDIRRLWVTATSTPLTETSGHVMFNQNSQNADAYNILLGEPVISKWSTDSTEMNILDYPTDTITTILSRSWISPAGDKFVKFNSFDYANATDSSVAQAFSAGLALPQVDNISPLDIILLQFKNTSDYAAIQITAVNNIDSTTSTDSYVFNIKK